MNCHVQGVSANCANLYKYLDIQDSSIEKKSNDQELELLACPICYTPLIREGPPGFNVPAIYWSGFQCQKCLKSYSSKEIFLDLTITSGTKDYVEFKPFKIELFRNPIVSFLYERGWRQSFSKRGFPGLDEEFKMAQEYFKPAEGGILVDVSCGSGLFSRKFAKSGTYSAVVALDLSENMLRQCYDFIKKDDNFLTAKFSLVRADVSRLPFSSGSVDAVHAGAALHCWPSPSNAVAEISRILRSGGVVVGTTFVSFESRIFPPQIKRKFRQLMSTIFTFLTEKEIADLFNSCGFVNYTCKIQQHFIIFSAQKP
ncbi:S-adenosyl-l-methionine-dependent methyltransferases superfamily protein [Thalictrum thalictroides]|uniref:S-adenosyl-l-methionine-dependent methyltransferases superfamily protein n=1 Tax=Thalictrum thalictroides TaxID=46969 RepID=A0A7J6XE03_THATH|nr:S-adenosyl-l-methionine-dependent methyltransferases superfamily protein [Thalictrum thalictroides]